MKAPNRAAMPANADAITPDWIETVLRGAGVLGTARVAGITRRVIGVEIGFLSQTVCVAIEYDATVSGAPASLVVKLEPTSEPFRATERGLRAFEREIRFYEDIAPRVPLRLPRIFHTAIADAGSVLVMEDLSHLRRVDQLHGLTQAEVIATVRAVAALHASYWNRAGDPTLSWVPAYDHFWEDGFTANWPAFLQTYELRIGPDAVRLGRRLGERLDQLLARIRTRPATLIHADLRADNLLFSPDGAVILDWQLATRSLGLIDVARLLGGSEPAAERRGHQLEVFAAWHEALRDGGVAGYPFEEALDDFRLAVLYGLLIPIKSFSLIGPDAGARTQRLVDVQAERLFASALELDAGAALD